MQAYFPRAVRLTLVDGSTKHFAAGLQDIPDALASHWWLIANGVFGIPAVRPT
jgi:hypothetical protein